MKSDEKLLAIDVPAGKYTMEVAYRDRFLLACLPAVARDVARRAHAFARGGWRWLKAERVRWATMPTWPDEEMSPPAAKPEVKPEAEAKADPEPEPEPED